MASRFDEAIAATDRALRTSRPLRTWLASLRWCGDSIRGTTRLTVRDRAVLSESGSEAIVFFLLLATGPDPDSRPIHLPLSIGLARLDPQAFELEADDSTFYVMEAERRESFARFAVDALRRGTKVPTETGDSLTFRGEGIGAFRGVSPIPGGDTSNVLLRVATASGDAVLKSYKFLDPGNREPEILARLQARRFRHAARFLGEVALGRGEDRLVLGMMSEHVEADDVFTWLRDALRDSFGGDVPLGEDFAEGTRRLASDLGGATAALHEALMDRHPGPWHPEPFTEEDFHGAFKSATRSLGAALRRLALLGRSQEPTVAESARRARAQLLDLRAPIERTLRLLEGNVGGVKTVIHSDLHLAQVLRRRTDGELLFIDFEGEPDRPPSERGRKLPPLRDVGSMVRSFAYVRHFAIRDLATDASTGGRDRELGTPSGPGDVTKDGLIAWEAKMVGAFTAAYLSRSTLHPGLDMTGAWRLIRGWAMEKALYELDYELKHRISNVPIPLDGIAELAASSSAVE
jgi:maltose alpha-D-glucosyltransferase/alpha-amylase